jgi:hypothetical protein
MTPIITTRASANSNSPLLIRHSKMSGYSHSPRALGRGAKISAMVNAADDLSYRAGPSNGFAGLHVR